MAGPLVGDPCKNWLPARIGGWPGTATGGQIYVVHISHTHPLKELIQTQRIYLLGKNLQTLSHFSAKICNIYPYSKKIIEFCAKLDEFCFRNFANISKMLKNPEFLEFSSKMNNVAGL